MRESEGGWKRKVAVAAELVGGANPGEKEKLGYRGEKGEDIWRFSWSWEGSFEREKQRRLGCFWKKEPERGA